MKEKLRPGINIALEYCSYILLFFIPISSAAVEIFAGLGIVLFITKKSLNPDFKLFKTKTHIFVYIFFGFCALSLFNSGEYLSKSLSALFLKWLEYILIFLFIQDSLNTRSKLRNAVVVLLFSAALVGIDGILQRFAGFEFLRHRTTMSTDNGLIAITGPFKHFNDFGSYLIVALGLAIGALSSFKLKINKIIVFLLITLILTCLSFTYSRGSWLGSLLLLILLFVLSPQKKLSAAILFLFLIFLMLAPGTKERKLFSIVFQTVEQIQNKTNSWIILHDADRFRVWNTALKMIWENPLLGKGVGTFMSHFSKYSPTMVVQYAHNCYLQIWAETGIFALLSFLGFCFFLLQAALKRFRINHEYIILGICCGLIGFLIHSFFDTQLYTLQLSVLFWAISGLLYSLSLDRA